MATTSSPRAGRFGRLGWGAALAQHAASLALAFVFVVPLAWMAVVSLHPTGVPPSRTLDWLPSPPAWVNYRTIFSLVPLGRYALNSLLVASVAVVITLVTASWAGLAMARMGPARRGQLVTLSIGLLLVPATALWLPRFVLFTWMGLIDSYWSLLATAFMGSSPFFVLLFYWTYRRLPDELFESAELDGAGVWTVWWRLALPLSTATLAAVAVLTFLLYWSSFMEPLLYLKSPDRYTLPIGVQQLYQIVQTDRPLLMAAAVVMTAPNLLLFLVAQRFFLGRRLMGLAAEG